MSRVLPLLILVAGGVLWWGATRGTVRMVRVLPGRLRSWLPLVVVVGALVVGAAVAMARLPVGNGVVLVCLPVPCAVMESRGSNWADYVSPATPLIWVLDLLLVSGLVLLVASGIVRRRFQAKPSST